MRSFLPAVQLSLLFSALGSALPSDLSPFILAIDGQETIYTNNDTSAQSPAGKGSPDLFKRQNCAANYYYCSTIVTTAVCCRTDAICSQDNSGNAACCPLGSFCTGTIPIASAAAATGSSLLTSTNNAGGIVIITATSTVPINTVAATAFTTALASSSSSSSPPPPPSSYVPNSYNFPFPYISTAFANSAACASAYSGCAAEYSLCTSDLQAGVTGYGVTISAPGGGGTTVAGPTTAGTSLGAAAAASVCASLSNVACPGIAGGCGVFGTAATAAAAGGTATGGVTGSSGAGRAVGAGEWGVWLAGAVALGTGAVGWLL